MPMEEVLAPLPEWHGLETSFIKNGYRAEGSFHVLEPGIWFGTTLFEE